MGEHLLPTDFVGSLELTYFLEYFFFFFKVWFKHTLREPCSQKFNLWGLLKCFLLISKYFLFQLKFKSTNGMEVKLCIYWLTHQQPIAVYLHITDRISNVFPSNIIYLIIWLNIKRKTTKFCRLYCWIALFVANIKVTHIQKNEIEHHSIYA